MTRRPLKLLLERDDEPVELAVCCHSFGWQWKWGQFAASLCTPLIWRDARSFPYAPYPKFFTLVDEAHLACSAVFPLLNKLLESEISLRFPFALMKVLASSTLLDSLSLGGLDSLGGFGIILYFMGGKPLFPSFGEIHLIPSVRPPCPFGFPVGLGLHGLL